MHAYRRIQPPEAAILEAHRSPPPGSRAAPVQSVEPAILTPAVPNPSAAPGCARKTASRQACHTTPLNRVNCAYAEVVAALPHACSDCVSACGA